jgi:glucan phosphorylase
MLPRSRWSLGNNSRHDERRHWEPDPEVFRGSVNLFFKLETHSPEEEIKRLIVSIREKLRNQLMHEPTAVLARRIQTALDGFADRLFRHALEGHIEGVTGWSIGPGMNGVGWPRNDAEDAATLYAKLDQSIYPLFNENRRGFIEVMRHAIALNASFFNTQRMVLQYLAIAWFL